MKSKRILSIILAVLLAFGSAFVLTSCSKDKGGSEGAAKDSDSPSVNDVVKTDFDLSEIENESLRKFVEAAGVRKHNKFMTPKEIEEIEDMITGTDYKEVTLDEYFEFFDEAMKLDSELNLSKLESIKKLIEVHYDVGEFYYAGRSGDWLIEVSSEDCDDPKNGELPLHTSFYNISEKRIIHISKGEMQYLFTKIDKNGNYVLFLNDDNTVRYAASTYSDDDVIWMALYDESGNLLEISDSAENYYNGNLKPISKEEFEKINETIPG